MKNEKYYTPNIEDIRVGYECEICPNLGYDDEWIKVIGKCKEVLGNGVKDCNLAELTYDCLIDSHIGIRTSYLTKEQIEKEDWLFKVSYGDAERFSKANYNIFYYYKDCMLSVIMTKETKEDISIFGGKCNSINEFRWICKLLNI